MINSRLFASTKWFIFVFISILVIPATSYSTTYIYYNPYSYHIQVYGAGPPLSVPDIGHNIRVSITYSHPLIPNDPVDNPPEMISISSGDITLSGAGGVGAIGPDGLPQSWNIYGTGGLTVPEGTVTYLLRTFFDNGGGVDSGREIQMILPPGAPAGYDFNINFYTPTSLGNLNHPGYIGQWSVSEPSTLLLLGFGLIGFIGFRKKFRK